MLMVIDVNGVMVRRTQMYGHYLIPTEVICLHHFPTGFMQTSLHHPIITCTNEFVSLLAC